MENKPFVYTPPVESFFKLSQISFSKKKSINELFLSRIQKNILENIEYKNYSVVDLAASVPISVSQLNRKLNYLLGRTAGKIIIEMRLKCATELLIQNTEPIKEIAYRLGFNDQSHFCKSFKRQYQTTPTAYRKRFGDLNIRKRFV